MSETDGVGTEPGEPRTSFNNVADIYHRIRPGYPPALFDDIFGLLPARPHVLEVGPGTGQATRDLLARGATVRAIEIGRGDIHLMTEALGAPVQRETSDLALQVVQLTDVGLVRSENQDFAILSTPERVVSTSGRGRLGEPIP